MSDSGSARRLGAPRWLDVRVGGGILLVLVAIVVGARVFSAADRYSLVWAAAQNLSPGQQLTSSDVTAVRVRLGGVGGNYISASRPMPGGYVVVAPVGPHDLLPVDAVGPAGATPSERIVAVPVTTGHFDPALTPGSVVDVYLTVKNASGTATSTRLVLAGATVQARESGAASFGSAGSTVTVLLAVPVAAVSTVVGAVEAGSLDLVDVPR